MADGSVAQQLAKRQKEISVAEFFTKNRHLLGFDNKRKALLMTVKEAVDNSLDACEETDVMPEIHVEIVHLEQYKYRVVIEDNGPGIVKKQIPNIFGKLLYGSKFHTLKQSRGQQGIGISAAVLYAQLTTGRTARITSRISPKKDAHYYELTIDTKKNMPIITKDKVVNWHKDHGTRIELDLEADYIKGRQSVDEYLKQTAITNPHATFVYTNPKAEQVIYASATETMPVKAKAIKPHPYGVELGRLMNMLSWTDAKSLSKFLQSEFSRIGSGTAQEICKAASLMPRTKPSQVGREMAEKLLKAMQETKIIAPPTDCLSPIGEEELQKGLRKEVRAEFYATKSRSPVVYRGNPFLIEVGVAFGGDIPKDGRVSLLRFANRVPLLYQEGACSMTKSLVETNWKSYGLQQSGNSFPIGPMVVVVHMASAWVPFTSESKEAIAHYNEIIKEIKLALQDCGRKLGSYVRKKRKVSDQIERANMFERFIPEIAESLAELSGRKKEKILDGLQKMIEKPELQNELKIARVDPDEEMYRMSFDSEEADSEDADEAKQENQEGDE